LEELVRRSRGRHDLRIALLDGVVHRGHPLLHGVRLEQEVPVFLAEAATASAHATLIASIWAGRGEGTLGLCPDCTILSLPVVDRRFERGELAPAAAAARIAAAIGRAVTVRADVIQLSMAFDLELDQSFTPVVSALSAAAARGIFTFIAAGNEGTRGSSAVLRAPGVVPVAMAGVDGLAHPRSALGPTLGARGILAPGAEVPGAIPPDGLGSASGTSFAAALATGAFVLLRSCFPARSPPEILAALRRQRGALRPSRSLVPPRLDGEDSFNLLNQGERHERRSERVARGA
jgi:subtilisin family serine protease